jgi:hypothetical protein
MGLLGFGLGMAFWWDVLLMIPRRSIGNIEYLTNQMNR